MTKTTNHDYTVKNVKTFQGMEGMGFSCSLYKATKKIATVTDSAWGGEYEYYWDDPTQEAILTAYLQTLPQASEELYDLWAMDTFLGSLVDEYENAKRLRAMCRKSWVFASLTDPEKLHVWDKKFPKEAIIAKFGDKIGECLNPA